ncbi:hypothetical protein ACQ4PT_005216 [Festuca glaucescens]
MVQTKLGETCPATVELVEAWSSAVELVEEHPRAVKLGEVSPDVVEGQEVELADAGKLAAAAARATVLPGKVPDVGKLTSEDGEVMEDDAVHGSAADNNGSMQNARGNIKVQWLEEDKLAVYGMMLKRTKMFVTMVPLFHFGLVLQEGVHPSSDKTDEAELQAAVEQAARLLEPYGATIVEYTSEVDATTIPGHYVVYWELMLKDRCHDAAWLEAAVFEKCCLEMEEALNSVYR